MFVVISRIILRYRYALLAAMAALYGVKATSADRARVLELGCASGGNIVPLAARFPDARFMGLDLSRRHVEAVRERVAALGLENIDIRQADLTSARLPGEAFDYVICHGVYSWVPEATQDELLGRIEAGKVTTVWAVDPAAFFRMAVEHCAEGYYSDPDNGGNRDGVSWRMMGFEVTG